MLMIGRPAVAPVNRSWMTGCLVAITCWSIGRLAPFGSGRAPWQAGVGHLLARGVADHDGIVVGPLRRPGLQGHLGLALKGLEVALQQGRGGGERLRGRLDADEFAVDRRHDALGGAERLLLVAAALRARIAPQQNGREDEARQHEGGTERHQALANRVTSR